MLVAMRKIFSHKIFCPHDRGSFDQNLRHEYDDNDEGKWKMNLHLFIHISEMAGYGVRNQYFWNLLKSTSKGSFRSRKKIVKVSFPGVAMWGSCGVGELRCGVVMGWGSRGVG